MPKNRFPDSISKRELRRRAGRQIKAFRETKNLSLGLSYCGMPSVEFLDVRAWKDSLRSVCAVEINDEILSDMFIQWDLLDLRIPIRFIGRDVLDFLHETETCYDLYNLDFFGGLINLNASGGARCIDALRSLVHRHSSYKQSFILVATFNVRDSGVGAYLDFIGEVPKALAGWRNIDRCCSAHKKNQATRLKLCFPYFCWLLGVSDNFKVRFKTPFVYQSYNTRLVHFYVEFNFEERALPDLASSSEVLASLINMSLLRLDGMIPRVDLAPPQVGRVG